MSEIIFKEKEKTMTSLELRDIINSARAANGERPVRNDDFVKRIEDELEGELGRCETFAAPKTKTPMKGYLLTRDQCTLVGMRESKAVRRAVLQKLKEVEQANCPLIPQTYAEALRLAADQAEVIEAQQLLLEQQKPAVQFLENFVETKSTKGLREVAKVLGLKEREFVATLEEQKILFRQSGQLLPFAQFQHNGYFEVKTGEANGHAFHQTRFTPKGIAWITKRLGLTEN